LEKGGMAKSKGIEIQRQCGTATAESTAVCCVGGVGSRAMTFKEMGEDDNLLWSNSASPEGKKIRPSIRKKRGGGRTGTHKLKKGNCKTQKFAKIGRIGRCQRNK